MSRAVSKSADKGMIIDPNGLSLFRLTMMVITASICGGIFALAGDMAAGGANTGAVLVSWAICFVGVFSLMMCFNGLSQARPDLTGGIYAYAAAGFTKYVGFNSAWGYWISACLSNVSFAILLFSALGYFFHPFESGNNLLSCVCASIFLWVLVVLVARDVGRATVIGFSAVFVLYLIISVESMGIMPRAEMAALATPSMAGILEHAIGPVGAGIVNLGVVLSLLGAMLGYVIIAAETPFEAARQGVFPKAFARTNKNGAPIVTVLISAGITQLFLIVSVFSSSTYQFFYACAVSTILIPYVCSAAYYMKIAWKRESLQPDQVVKARVLGTVGFVYTVFLVWAAGIVGIMITTILFAPGIIVYVVGQKGRGEPILPHVADKIIAAVIVAVMILSIALMATGTISVF